LRNVEGDFTIQVRIGGEFCPAGQSGQCRAGLFLTDGHGFALKLVRVAVPQFVSENEKIPTAPFCTEYARRGVGSCSIYAYKEKPDNLREAMLPSTRFVTAPFLRIERQGTTLRVAVSEDGKDWIPMQPPFGWRKDMELPRVLKIGVVAESTVAGPFKAQFDKFKITKFLATP
jgi:hypothetical protein